MDFLKEVVPAEKITGVIVLRAHNVVENSQVDSVCNEEPRDTLNELTLNFFTL